MSLLFSFGVVICELRLAPEAQLIRNFVLRLFRNCNGHFDAKNLARLRPSSAHREIPAQVLPNIQRQLGQFEGILFKYLPTSTSLVCDALPSNKCTGLIIAQQRMQLKAPYLAFCRYDTTILVPLCIMYVRVCNQCHRE